MLWCFPCFEHHYGSFQDAEIRFPCQPGVIRERVAALRVDAKMHYRVVALRSETLALPDPTALVREVETLVASAR